MKLIIDQCIPLEFNNDRTKENIGHGLEDLLNVIALC